MFKAVDANNFNEQLSGNGLAFVNIWADWNWECRKMMAIMGKLGSLLNEQDSIKQIDWDNQKQLAQKLGVFGIPTLLVYAGGNEVARYSGIVSIEDLLKRIIELKAKDIL